MSRIIIFILPFLLILTSITPAQGQNMVESDNKVEVVDSVNIEKYCGLWYEIARIPNSFQDKCAGRVTAEYELREDGKLKVINKCVKKDGSINKVKGIAKVTGEKSNAKLKISFVQLFGINLFWGDYWIIGLDKEYEWAIIGHPKRKYGWILSRESALSDSTMSRIDQILKNQGYDPDRFNKTNQREG